ncbi:MAG TPA: cytochrome P450 [Herpetosiphonaceae bacterium]|nr:cytochrome P450 [Herpetosiphonaceae bacterium]
MTIATSPWIDQAEIPQPKLHPLLGNVPELDSDGVIQSLMELARELGPIFRITTPARTSLIISSQELVAEACDEARFDKFVHGPLQHIRDFAGDGLFTARTAEANWGKAHRLLMPAFGPLAMRNYFDDMVDIADQMLTKWERLGPKAVIDVPDNMTRLTLDTIALSGFAYRFNSFYQREMHPFVEAMVRSLDEAGQRSRRLPLQTRLMPLTQRQYNADNALMRQITGELIAERRALPQEQAPRDLLGLMLGASDPLTGERLDDANIRNQLVTFLIAGHETTSGLLSFAVHLLLQNPAVLRRAQALADEVLGDRMPRYEDIARLGYFDQILRETLRLYPTAPAFAVYAREDTTLAGRYQFKQNDVLMILTPMLHRDPAAWADPERFDPDRFAPGAEIPEHAWLPFGNGQRSCIGRAFALQEATLVLAMLVQRFDIAYAGPYRLVIKETLTLKPDNLRIQARARTPIQRAQAAQAAPAVAPSASQATAAGHGTPLLLLYGSNSGSSEAFARRIASDGEGRGYAARVAPLDDYAGRLPREGAAVIVTASYNGQPPDNARRFADWLETAPAGSLAGVRYALFGCGSRDWAATYQAVPGRFDSQLRAAGARAVLPRGEGDARGDFFGDFERWYGPFWDALNAELGLKGQVVDAGPLYAVEIVPTPSAELVQINKLDFATITENRELVDLSAPFGRSKRHIAFALPEGAAYAAGDYLAVLPENHPELVARAARRFNLRPDAAVVLRSARSAMAASLPTGQPITVRDLLGRHVELSAPATRNDVRFLAEHNPCPPHRDELAALAADAERYGAEILARRVSLLDLLEQYQSCDVAFGGFLELLPAMRVRQYSISSSPLAGPRQCSLTVAVVEAPAWSGHGLFHGTASSFLARLQPGDSAAVAIRTPNAPFRPPLDNAAPMVMIGAGTGLAPFRGFIQERALRRERGEAAGASLLFFGCDHPQVDFLYRDELAAWERAGVVEVFPAFCRQPAGEVMFVQHRLWQERERVRALINQGAAIFLCGDGLHMAPAVRETLIAMRQEAAGCSQAEAAGWLLELERSGRFVADVFGA